MKNILCSLSLLLIINTTVYSKSLYPVNIQGKWGYINEYAKIVTPPEYSYAYPQINGMGKIMQLKNGVKLYGYVNSDGRLLFHPRFEKVSVFKNGYCRVLFQGKWTFINTSGKIISDARFDYAGDFNNSRALVMINNKYGYINTSGKLAINTNFLWGSDFRDGLAVVKVRITPSNSYYPVERYAYINKTGNYYFKPIFKQARPFLAYRAPVIFENTSAWTFINSKGLTLTNLFYSDLGDYHGGLARFKSGNYWGYLDKQSKVVIAADYSYALDFRKGIAWVNKGAYSSGETYQGGKWGLINETGQLILAPIFERISTFQKGAAVIWKEGQPGLVYINGNYRIYSNYNWIHPFHEGLARVEIKKRYAYINTSGKKVLQGDFLAASDFNNGIASVLVRKKTLYTKQYINTSGKVLWKDTYDSSRPFKKEDEVFILAYPGLELKKEPSLKSKKIYRIPYGEKVQILSNLKKRVILTADGLYGYWIEIDYKGTRGYLFAPYLSKLPAPVSGMGFKQYFDLMLGKINTASTFQLTKREVFHYAAVRVTEFKYSSSESTYTIVGPNMQEMIVVIKAALGFAQMPVPDSYSSQRIAKNYLAMTVARYNKTKIERIHISYAGPRGNERIELIALSPHVIKIIHNYSY